MHDHLIRDSHTCGTARRADAEGSGVNRGSRQCPFESDVRLEVTRYDFAPPTLAKLGITRDQSSQWQRMAAVPDKPLRAVRELPDFRMASICP
jgi:hypothetical protein